MTTNTISPAVATDWTEITSFRFRFAEHAQYPGIHSKFDFAFSYEITEPDDLYTDAELRTTLHPSAITLVRMKIVDSIKSQATSTADTTKILPMFNHDSIFVWFAISDTHLSKSWCFSRSRFGFEENFHDFHRSITPAVFYKSTGCS